MKILIVDDHTYNRDLLAFILEDEGHECVEAKNGQEAVDIFESDQGVELILMDVNMPVMGGIEATTIIKKKSEDRFVPVIFITALDDTEMLSKCLEAGGDDFVPKPVNENALIAKMKAHSRTRNLYNEVSLAKKNLEYHNLLMEREHAIVEHVFKQGVNRVKSTCDNVHMYTSPMSMFNGDVVLQSPSPSGGVYVLLGDFTGHGLAASIGTLPVTEIFYSLAEKQASVSQMSEVINRRLFEMLPTNMFFCAVIVHVCAEGKNLTIWAGGMNDAMVGDDSDHSVRAVPSCHMPIGILNAQEFDDSATLIELKPTERIYFFSDGVNEAVNQAGEEFGLERVEQIIAEGGDNVVQKITDTVHAFQDGSGQSDDLSLLEVCAGKLIHRDKSTSEIIDVAALYHTSKSFPWSLSMTLKGDDLKSTSVVDQIMAFVASIQGIELHQDKIFTIVSELYSNALEHGVLGLSSSLKQTADGFETYYKLREERLENVDGHSICVDLTYKSGSPNKIELVITDSGQGFDYENALVGLSEDDASHGRGLGLLQSLCADMQYSNAGKTVTILYELCR